MAPTLARRARLGADLLEAAFAGLHRDVARLLEQGADVEAVDRSGYTALSEAAMAGHTVVVGQLLRALADPDQRCAEDGRTPLHRAAFHGWVPVLKLLLEGGADPSLKDDDGKTAADLARSEKARLLLLDWPPEKTKEAAGERQRQLSLRPPPPEEEEIEDAAPAVPDDQAPASAAEKDDSIGGADTADISGAVAPDAPGKALAFAPPPRRGAAAAAEAQVDREAKYREAMDKLRDELGDNAVGDGLGIPSNEPPLIAYVEVKGTGEDRLNGFYKASFVTKERVEYQKDDDNACQVFWSDWHNEWRMLIGDFKLGSTLYRHTYRPNTKADECHGVPQDGWQKWFGKGPEPTIVLHPDGRPPQQAPEESPDGADAMPAGVGEDATRAPVAEQTTKRSTEFIELHPRLEIVAKDEGAPELGTAAATGSRASADVRLSSGGERLIETADGLFTAHEVCEHSSGVVDSAAEADARAAAWLEDIGPAPPVPAQWEAIQAAKAAAQDLYSEGKVGDARQATTAAIAALRRFSEAPQAEGADPGGHNPSAEEVDALLGTMCSNRSLLLAQQIQAGDADVLAIGIDAAWRLVASDATAALLADALNFKASFRRARALFELGELEAALSDATRVVDYYARNSKTPNPEAVALRDQVLEAVRKERSKWGERGRARWNRASNDDFITEVVSTRVEQAAVVPIAPFSSATMAAKKAAAAQASAANPAPASSVRPMAAPRNGADVEKALLSTLKEEPARLLYVKEHLTAQAIRKLFQRAPLGPDLLGAVVRLLAALAAEGGAAEALGGCAVALAATPSAKTHAAMFDAQEKKALCELLRLVGPEVAKLWGVEEASSG